MKIGIVGNGAIGNLLAWRGHQQQKSVFLATRNGHPLNLTVEDAQTGGNFSPRVHAIDDLPDCELLLLPLKAYQIIPCLTQLAPQLPTHCVLLLMHNGMGTHQAAQNLLPRHCILAATTSHGAYKSGSQHVHIKGWGHSEAGILQNPQRLNVTPHQQQLHDLLAPCAWPQDIQQVLWKKLLINSVINPLTALHQIPNGELKKEKFSKRINMLCKEGAHVATACGYKVTPAQMNSWVMQVIEQTAHNLSSMNRDVAAGRPTESAFISGYLLSQARQQGIDIPNHQALYNALSEAINATNHEPVNQQ